MTVTTGAVPCLFLELSSRANASHSWTLNLIEQREPLSQHQTISRLTNSLHARLHGLNIASAVQDGIAMHQTDKRKEDEMSSTTATSSGISDSQGLSLAGLIAYQEGAVVSRVILKREKGNVTLFAFDEGQGLSEHTSPFDALVHGIEGDAEVTVAGKAIALKQGEVVLLPAEKPHAVRAVTRFKMVLTMIRS